MNMRSISLLLAIAFGSIATVAAPPEKIDNQARVTVYVLGPVTYPGKLEVQQLGRLSKLPEEPPAPFDSASVEYFAVRMKFRSRQMILKKSARVSGVCFKETMPFLFPFHAFRHHSQNVQNGAGNMKAGLCFQRRGDRGLGRYASSSFTTFPAMSVSR